MVDLKSKLLFPDEVRAFAPLNVRNLKPIRASSSKR